MRKTNDEREKKAHPGSSAKFESEDERVTAIGKSHQNKFTPQNCFPGVSAEICYLVGRAHARCWGSSWPNSHRD